MPPRLPFEQKLAEQWPAERWQGVGVVVAVSGGPDSVALLRALARMWIPGGGTLSAAHFNHGLRGQRAAIDQRFVVELCRSLGLECTVGRAEPLQAGFSDEGPSEPGSPEPGSPENAQPETDQADTDLAEKSQAPSEGVEAAARKARYAFLAQTAESHAARYVVTGHTADDQAETVLHHILRGTGLAGLRGMRRARSLSPAVTLVRPMLAIRRGEVLAYLRSLGQPYQRDETNLDRSFMRNRIRHELMPLLEGDYAPAIRDALVRLAAVAGDAQGVLESLAEALLAGAIVARRAGRLVLDCDVLREADRHLVREALVAAWREADWPRQAMGWEQWNLLAEMALEDDRRSTARQVLPGAIHARREGTQLVLTRDDGQA